MQYGHGVGVTTSIRGGLSCHCDGSSALRSPTTESPVGCCAIAWAVVALRVSPSLVALTLGASGLPAAPETLVAFRFARLPLQHEQLMPVQCPLLIVYVLNTGVGLRVQRFRYIDLRPSAPSRTALICLTLGRSVWPFSSISQSERAAGELQTGLADIVRPPARRPTLLHPRRLGRRCRACAAQCGACRRLCWPIDPLRPRWPLRFRLHDPSSWP